MPFDIFRLFRNRRDRGDVAAFEDDHGQRGRRYLLKKPSSKRKEPFFTPLPSRAPTDPEEGYRDEYALVHNPSTVMGGSLNARPTTLEDPVSPSSLHGYSNRSEYPRVPRDDIPYADRYHEDMAGRRNPEGPVVINHSSRSMSPTYSDRTFKNHRPAAWEYPGTRIIPPPPHHRPRDYVAAETTPTNIYGSHRYDAYPEGRGIHRAESYRRGPTRSYSKRVPPIQYIVPGGMDVIFQDERGREIKRVMNSNGRRGSAPTAPFIVHDPSGQELYRYDGPNGPHPEPPILRVRRNPARRGENDSSPMYLVEPHEVHNDSRHDRRYSVDRRGHGRYGSYENHRNHMGRGAHRDPREYDDYRGRGDYKRHDDYPRRTVHEDPRHHGGYEDHQDYEVHTGHGQPERDSPSALQGLHRTHSHSSHGSLSGVHEDLLQLPVDDRRSGMSRTYEGSVHGSMHPEALDEGITDRLDSFHVT
ncbi:hypothetical protein EDD17DRAFT_311293 [Pisolithus thermaeus]|nr:hypothetical protein EDD17DRAFT_311293 [Pisolithus thermaeus]